MTTTTKEQGMDKNWRLVSLTGTVISQHSSKQAAGRAADKLADTTYADLEWFSTERGQWINEGWK